jgi:hypothetical protein
MRTLYEAANAVEAHMLLDLLRQQGIEAQIRGEHLQGAVGDLPAAGLVRLEIEDERYGAARAVIDEWEAMQPPAPVASRAGRPARLRWLMLGIVLGAGGLYGLVRTPVSTEGIDYDRDGRVDETWTYSARGTALKMESDRNHDGKVDYVLDFDERGLVMAAESDDDFDGRFETRYTFVDGNVETSRSDTDGDGFLDLRSYYRHGVLERSEHLEPLHGRLRRVEHYRLGKLVTADVDTDGDGELDVTLEYSGLAEVLSRRPYRRPLS